MVGENGQYTDDLVALAQVLPVNTNDVIVEFKHTSNVSFLAIGWHRDKPDDKWSINEDGYYVKHVEN